MSKAITAKDFWARVQKSRGCWIWQGARLASGHGLMTSRLSGSALAHRTAYILAVGPIPPDKELHHTCSNPPCVKPAHLVLVSRRDHVQLDNPHVPQPLHPP